MSLTRNHIRIACFAASLTTTRPSTTSATRTSPRSSAAITDAHEIVRGRRRAGRRATPSPASQSCVTCFSVASSTGRPFVSGAAPGPRHRGGRARAAVVPWVARARGARGRRRPRRRGRRATTSVPACASRAAISHPSSAPSRGAQPQVEGARAAVVDETVRGEAVAHQLAPFLVAVPLLGDVLVVGERGGRRRLHRRRHHQARVLAGLDEVRDQVRVAGVEAARASRRGSTASRGCAPRARWSSPALEDRRGLGRVLGVALVARDDDAAAARPLGDRARSAPASATELVGLPGSLTQSTSARSASAGAIESRSRCQSVSTATGTARQPASVAPIS